MVGQSGSFRFSWAQWAHGCCALLTTSLAWAGATEYFLPKDLPIKPAHFDLARAATVRLQAADGGAGTAEFISNTGYLLTAKHVLGGNLSEPTIPELGGQGKIRVVYLPKDLDAAILKVEF